MGEVPITNCRHLIISIFVAEKGGSRTLRGPYDPQTGFEDQRHHRAPSFSIQKISYLRLANRSSVTIPVAICEVPKAAAISCAFALSLWPAGFHRHVDVDALAGPPRQTVLR